MTIDFYVYDHDVRIVDKSNYLPPTAPYRGIGNTVEGFSLETPSITCMFNTLPHYNYAHIIDLEKYYFIKNIRFIANNLYVVDMEIDVLNTYKAYILDVEQMIERREDVCTPGLPDPLIQTSASIKTTTTKSPAFTTSATAIEDGYNIVITASSVGGVGPGPVEAFIVDEIGFQKFAEELSLKSSSFLKFAPNPSDYIIDIKRYPYPIHMLVGNIGDKAQTMHISSTTLQVPNYKILSEHGVMSTSIFIPQGYSENQFQFLNYHPYTTISLYLPGVGIVPLPVNNTRTTSVTIQYDTNIYTGESHVTLSNGNILGLYTVKIGQTIPLIYENRRGDGLIASDIVSAVASGIVNPHMGAASIMNAVSSAIGGVYQNTTIAVESRIGNSSIPYFGDTPYVIIKQPYINRINMATFNEMYGQYYQAPALMSNVNGFCKVSNPIIYGAEIPLNDRNRIVSLLRSGVYI